MRKRLKKGWKKKNKELSIFSFVHYSKKCYNTFQNVEVRGKTTTAKKILKTDPKRVIRNKILGLLRSQKEEDRLRKSKIIQDKLFLTSEFKSAKTILFYASFNGEVETFSMMKQARKLGKKIVLPKIIKDQKKMTLSLTEDLKKGLVSGPYGIKEPDDYALRSLDPTEIDLVIVPGVAFDRKNNRLGRGAGYYDRFLVNFPSHIPIFGLAFDFQIVPRLPHQKRHDIPVSRVIVN